MIIPLKPSKPVEISVTQVCLAFNQARNERRCPYEILSNDFKVPEERAHLAAVRAFAGGFIDFEAGGLRNGWLTTAGHQRVAEAMYQHFASQLALAS
ncbi:hypothetical protein [Microvirga tunisiensis]|uniref:Uncharacterized protein n=1 Tax=Microvirga tunisiensis TaxID=2108360 RepID=A0A5N7MXS4_9HYPH|nr:hypothetical protein [Microvirga tunisiensis]MPR12966.1 hypothetical protein [Microvirga tunisiensis]MPR30894.1 hypothetical protein [Microvirga tunisiensis]